MKTIGQETMRRIRIEMLNLVVLDYTTSGAGEVLSGSWEDEDFQSSTQNRKDESFGSFHLGTYTFTQNLCHTEIKWANGCTDLF